MPTSSSCTTACEQNETRIEASQNIGAEIKIRTEQDNFLVCIETQTCL